MWKVSFPFFAALLAFGLCQVISGANNEGLHNAEATFGLDLPMAGGISKIEDADNDEEFQRALQFAVIQHNGTNDTVLHQVTKVVAGTNYIITVILVRTSCEKEGQAENCTIHKEPEHAQPYQCTFTVWSRPWLNKTQLTKEECLNDQPAPE
ncbi:cystatin-C-like isoform X2 [Girardinichthys multiradiatus]|uniref:cystatin-C-like isoform X2 n=1 Tax=Girardinichthys multiradiatus TaxID=208333 RepID=UPI001FAC7A4D|nr:cystatin-C-like isoform X2 [Girardinichthys multiradiatus]